MNAAEPSPQFIAAVEQRAQEVYERSVKGFPESYDRRRLKDMGIILWNPLDYSVANTELIIAKLELRLENLRKNPRHWSVAINPAIIEAELEAALYVEREHLRREIAA